MLITIALFVTSIGGMIGEGLSSIDADKTIEAGFRVFTIYTGPEACAAVDVPDELRAHPITLRVGDELLLTDLIVVAYTEEGQVIPGVPIGISHDAETDNVLVRDPHRERITYLASQVGQSEFSISYLCDSPKQVSTQLVVNVT